jgi:hypothetical protein
MKFFLVVTEVASMKYVLNQHLFQKLKLIGRGKFNYLINTLTFPLTCGLGLPFNR